MDVTSCQRLDSRMVRRTITTPEPCTWPDARGSASGVTSSPDPLLVGRALQWAAVAERLARQCFRDFAREAEMVTSVAGLFRPARGDEKIGPSLNRHPGKGPADIGLEVVARHLLRDG